MRAIILARVSTEEQMQDGQSIPAQLARSRQWCKDRGLEVKSEYQFDESSTKDQRTKFELVIDEIKRSKDKVALVVETIDRLQRSFKESVVLDEYRKNGQLEIHFIRENLVLNDQSNSSDLLRWDMGVMFARSYVLQLSDNVKRSISQKLLNGEFPGMAPVGYINHDLPDGKKTIVPDPDRAHLIAKMFELYGTGQHSVKTIKQELDRAGFITRTGKKLTTSLIHKNLRNPFYSGVMVVNGKEYRHKYEPLVPEWLFSKCQTIMDNYHKKPFKAGAKPYIFRGLIRCEKCGCLITPEISKGKYIYYSCTNFKGLCKRIWVPEEELLKPVYKALKAVQMPQEAIDRLTQDLKTTGQNESHFHKESMTALRADYDRLEDRIARMYEDKLDRSITQDMYDKKLKKWKSKKTQPQQ